MFDLVHGVPGAGKSRVIAWVRELFEQELCVNGMTAEAGASAPPQITDHQRRQPRDVRALQSAQQGGETSLVQRGVGHSGPFQHTSALDLGRGGHHDDAAHPGIGARLEQ